MPMKREHHFQIWYTLVALLALLCFKDYLAAVGARTEAIPYSQFQDMLVRGEVNNLVVDADRIRGDFKALEAGKPTHLDTVRVGPALAQSLGCAGATFAAALRPGCIGIVSPVMSTILPSM
jgi:cell division protease FtsH